MLQMILQPSLADFFTDFSLLIAIIFRVTVTLSFQSNGSLIRWPATNALLARHLKT